MHPDIRPWNLNQRQKSYNMLPSTCNLGYNALLGEGSGEMCMLCVILTSMLFMTV